MFEADLSDVGFRAVDSNVFYMRKTNGKLATFIDCPFNTKFEVSDEKNRTTRMCKPCDFKNPFSRGGVSDECKSCQDIEPYTLTDDPYYIYQYERSCITVVAEEQTNKPVETKPTTTDTAVVVEVV